MGVGVLTGVNCSAFFYLILIGAGFLTAIKRPGWHVLGVLIGIIYLYLGVAVITLPNEVGSWGVLGGSLSCWVVSPTWC